MKYLLLFLFISFSSCAEKVYHLRGSYPVKFTHTANNDIADVWNKVLELVYEKGLKIKEINKNTGTLILDDYSFIGMVTYENNKTGKPENPDAWLVTNRSPKFVEDETLRTPDHLLANWIIQLKNVAGKTSIQIDIANLRSVGSIPGNKTDRLLEIKSTGVFEKLVVDKLAPEKTADTNQ